MANEGASSSGFISWYKHLRKECKKGVIDSFVVAFNRRKADLPDPQFMAPASESPNSAADGILSEVRIKPQVDEQEVQLSEEPSQDQFKKSSD